MRLPLSSAVAQLILEKKGNPSQEEAGKLAQRPIEQWDFEPTYIAGQPIPKDCRIRLRLSPVGH